jgi:diguanylate cyclase (GGDEF)-like protein
MTSSQAEKHQANILIVDDIPDNLRVLSNTLGDQGYKVRSVINGTMALRVARSVHPDLILLDIKMPDIDGYQVCEQLKSDPETQDIPVIFLSALDETLDKVKAFSVGGVDYITKPFHFEEVLARINNQLQIQLARAEIKKLNEELEMRVIQRTTQLEKEISERQKVQEKLMHMILHDPLTELPNRTWLMKRLEQIVYSCQQHPAYLFAILFLDCDRFKVINDSLGHLVGDQLLIALSRRLESCLQPGNTLSRFGGDEFVIILEKINSPQDAIQLAKTIHRELLPSFHLDEHEVFTNVSIGIVIGNSNYQNSFHLLRDADIALYQAKNNGRGSYQLFDQIMYTEANKRLKLETDLRRVIEREEKEELVIYYQPIINLKTGQISGFESLIRWQHPERGLITPNEFLTIAEEAGFILQLDLWVLEKACQQVSYWQEKFQYPFTLNINFSPKHFSQSLFLNNCLKIEITENAIIEHDLYAQGILEEFKKRKIQVCIDDFGTGYSSLSYLYRFPVDILKIDRSFIQQIKGNNDKIELVKAIIALADQLNMQVVAEGVETAYQLQLLRNLNCEFGQGYFFAKPLESQLVENLLSQHQQW